MSNEALKPQEPQKQFSDEVADLHFDNLDNPDVFTSADRVKEGTPKGVYVSGHQVVNGRENMVSNNYSGYESYNGREDYTIKNTESARATTEAGVYETEMSDGTHVAAEESGVPTTSVTRIENGEKVTREIKNPKAGELVTKLALKKLRQSTKVDSRAA